ncbi:MAG TPA: PorP/SprF family type IX secretion system membrane protein [Chitinophagales bacterium]|nr:PorP/SprF family type IX secretion system membrane protein [Chitinophagales bacterium]
MKYISKITICLVAVLLIAGHAQAQDTRFSQPLNNQLALNPAMMGLTNDFRVNLNYRNQWASIDKGYSTYAASLIYPLFLSSKAGSADSTGKKAVGKSRLDFGINVTDDKSGSFNRLSASLSIAYGLKLSEEHSLHAAINFGYLHNSLNVLKLSFDEQYQLGAYNPDLPTGETPTLTKGAPDVGFGFMYHYEPLSGKLQAFAGIAGYHVNQPNQTFINGRGTLPARFNFQAGVKVIGNKLDFTPVVLYNLQGPWKQFTGGLLMAYKFDKKGKLVVGTWFKERDAISLQAGYEHKIFYFTYSYDFGISKLARTTRGLMTHEVALGFKFIDVAAKKGIKGVNFL